MRAIVIITTIIGAVAVATADFPANPGFEDDGGWHALASEIPVNLDGQHAAAGKRCLNLQGWVASEPTTIPTGGWLKITLAAQPVGGQHCAANLAIAFVTRDDQTPRPQLIITPTMMGRGGGRTVRAEIFAATSEELRLAIGTVPPSDDAAWLVDQIRVETARLPAWTSVNDTATEALPEGWEPDGLLDARERIIAGQAELVLDIGGLEVTMPKEISQPRGTREGLRIVVANRSGVAKTMTVTVQGPAGMSVPPRTVPIRPAGTMSFGMSAQSPRLGGHWIRVQLRVGEQTKAAPVRVENLAAYPAPGAAWTAETPTAEEIAAVLALGIGLHEIVSAPATVPSGTQLIGLIPQPWSAETVAAAVAQAGPAASFMALTHPRGEALPGGAAELTAQLADALRQEEGGGWALAPPVDPGTESTPAQIRVTAQLAADGSVVAQRLRPAPIIPATVRAVTVGKSPVTGPLPSWTEQSRATDLSETVAALRAQVALPVLISEICGQSSGSAALDALALARTLVTSAYQGTTGLSVCARPEDCPPRAQTMSLLNPDGGPRAGVAEVLAEVGRELAAAIPVRAFATDPRMGLAPDAEIGYRPFVRGDEGIVALFNNTGSVAELYVEIRTTPIDLHTLEVGPQGLRRSYRPTFKFSPEAHALGRQVLEVDLAPGQLTILSMQMIRVHNGWLGSVERRLTAANGG
jgi:hypothetical protein